MVVIKIDSHIRIDARQISKKVRNKLVRDSTHQDPVYAKNKRAGWGVGDLEPRMYTFEEHGNELRFWRGRLEGILQTLRAYKVDFEIDDHRLWLDDIALDCSVQLRDYQQEPHDIACRKQQTLVRAPAGSGKTEVMLKTAAHFQQPTLVLVWQERQQRNWLERIPKRFDFEPGGIGGAFKKEKIAPITVGMVQSVRNRMEMCGELFGTVICDEVQRFAARTLAEVVNNLPAAVRLGASDDERRSDGREFLLYDTFGPVGATVEGTTGQCPVRIVALPTQFESEFSSWVEAVDELICDEARNQMILDLAIAEAKAGHRILIWSDRVDHCLYLCGQLEKAGFSVGLILGGNEWKDEADHTEKGLRSGAVQIGIGTGIAEQSIDIPPLDRGIMTCASADTKMFRFRQMRGRLARPFEGKDSVLYYLWDRQVPQLRRKINNIRREYEVQIGDRDVQT